MSSTKTVLLTLGRLPVALDIARAFAAGGWRVVVADPWKMHLARMSRAVAATHRVPSPQEDPGRYLRCLGELASRERVDLIVPVSEEAPYVSALCGGEIPVFSAAQETMLRLHDKLAFIELAESLGIHVPQTARGDRAPAFCEAGPFVSKPRFSCSGRGVGFHSAGDAPPADATMVVQARLEGDPVSAFCVAVKGQTRLISAYRPTVSDGSVGVAFDHVEPSAAMRRSIERLIEAVDYTGFIAFDFIVGPDDNALPIECNPRATSGIHFVAPDALLAAILDEEVGVATGHRKLAESYSCFTSLLSSLTSPSEAARIFRTLRASRDVTWQRDDPWPFLLMMINSWPIVWRAATSSHTFASAAIADVEWLESPVHG